MEKDKKLAEYVSMATKRGYLYNNIGGLNWQISIQTIFLQKGEIKGVSIRNMH